MSDVHPFYYWTMMGVTLVCGFACGLLSGRFLRVELETPKAAPEPERVEEHDTRVMIGAYGNTVYLCTSPLQTARMTPEEAICLSRSLIRAAKLAGAVGEE